jgi:hypothetical protein
VSSHGTKLEKPNLSRIFRELSRQIGIRKPGARHGSRLHDFRHHSECRIIPSDAAGTRKTLVFLKVLSCDIRNN